MSPAPLKLLIITASVREERFGPVVSNWFLSRALVNERFESSGLDLADIELPTRLPSNIDALNMSEGRSPAMRELFARLEEAEAFVAVTPEYNHGYPASLKHLIDWHFSIWRCKPVAFVSYGGVSGGLRAVEQLRLVFAEMHATTLRDSISFDRFWEKFDEKGQLIKAEEANQAADQLLERLSWWALTLRRGREQLPYK
jgi:NAD(P)H-dependent FMN reductase